MNFGTSPTPKFCHVCRTWIGVFEDKVQCEKYTSELNKHFIKIRKIRIYLFSSFKTKFTAL